jgi:predicted MFS family arabinose efflux permease
MIRRVSASPDPAPAPLSRLVVALMAFACGASVANLYYAQPLLDEISSSLDVGRGAAGLVVTASQVGYALGLIFLVPLGDLLERRALVVRMLLVTAAGLAMVALAPSLLVLGIATIVVGVTSVVAQVIVPMASMLAPESERGRVVGMVMSGLLLGILSARTASGLIAELGGWRLVYALAAGLMLVCTAALLRSLPRNSPEGDIAYPALLRSIVALVREEPGLRRRMLYGAMGMMGFSAFWTALTFVLKDSWSYGEATIGLFGLLGIAGAASAQFAGRLADRGHLHEATGAFLACVLASWGLLALAPHSVPALAAGIVLFDLGVQGQHISNQNRIYALVPHARSRVTTAYMTGNFAFAAIGSAGASLAYGAGGWAAVCAIGAGAALIALTGWVAEHVGGRSPVTAES